MSRQKLHDLLAELEQQRNQLDPVNHEQGRRIDELIASLEEESLGTEGGEENAVISNRIYEMINHYEEDHPKIASILNAIGQVLQSFRV